MCIQDPVSIPRTSPPSYDHFTKKSRSSAGRLTSTFWLDIGQGQSTVGVERSIASTAHQTISLTNLIFLNFCSICPPGYSTVTSQNEIIVPYLKVDDSLGC